MPGSAPGHRIQDVRCDFHEGFEDESPRPEVRVRQLERRSIQDQVTDQDEIQVERARCTGKRAGPSSLTLDAKQFREKAVGREASDSESADRNRVQKSGLRIYVDGCGVVKRGRLEIRQKVAQLLERVDEMRRTRLNVASKRDDRKKGLGAVVAGAH